MDALLQPLAALCWGIAAAAGGLYLLQALAMLEVEKRQDAERRQLPLLFRLALPLVPNIRFIARSPAFHDTCRQSGERLLMAGYDEQTLDGETFLALRLLIGLIGVIAGAVLVLAGQPLSGLLVLGLLAVWPGVWLRKSIARRHLQIQKALPNILDLLTLSVEAGKDFITALRDILHRRRRRDALHEELERTFHEIQLGKPRREALRDLSRRVRQPDLSAVVNAIVQADELGVSIAQLLRIQGDQFRTKRFQRAETLANKAPVKIIFPIVAFILPAVFIILLGPLAMQALKTLFNR